MIDPFKSWKVFSLCTEPDHPLFAGFFLFSCLTEISWLQPETAAFRAAVPVHPECVFQERIFHHIAAETSVPVLSVGNGFPTEFLHPFPCLLRQDKPPFFGLKHGNLYHFLRRIIGEADREGYA